MRFLVFIPPKDFRDESLSMVKLFFSKWGVDCKVTSYSSKECVGSHGAVITPDINTSKVFASEYDGIALIDGGGIDEYKLCDYRPLLDLILNFDSSRKYIISMGNSVKIPARANVIGGKKIATNDRESARLATLFHGVLSNSNFEMAGNMITIKSSSDIEDCMQQILEHMGVT
ncbi:MAG: DJ-1/PfpI family protein [Candidatus Micrarchaeaceae archaeon]|jgi:putative intracellular protease/amidase